MLKKNPEYVFIFLLLLMSIAYNYQGILFDVPYSIHQWRQADGLSITLNYYKENLNFFQPSLNWIGYKGTGKAVGEFPIFYYIVAQLWKLFGQHEFIFRLLNVIIVYIGLYHLYKLFKMRIQNTFWSIFSVLIIFTSPILVYYTNNFIPDAPALGLAMIACYHMNIYFSSQSSRALYLSCLFFLFAGLLKITILIILLALLPLIIYLILKHRDKYKFNSLIPIAFIFIPIIAWIKYADYYNSANNKNVFLQQILPIWNMNSAKIKDISLSFFHTILPSAFNITVLFILLFLYLFSVANYKKANAFLLMLTTMTLGGSIVFILLFFQNLGVHDYYLISLLIVVPLILLTFIDLILKTSPEFFTNRSIKILASIVLLMLIYQTTIITRMKYNVKDLLVNNSFIIDRFDLEYWNWYHWNYDNTLKPLETIKPYLASLGISRDDFVISIPDQSLNISLYLMDVKGFT
ncbi:MAG: glycosyltransferase family 39 protein, partial [Saprospiraceae bacterium]